VYKKPARPLFLWQTILRYGVLPQYADAELGELFRELLRDGSGADVARLLANGTKMVEAVCDDALEVGAFRSLVRALNGMTRDEAWRGVLWEVGREMESRGLLLVGA
jgi:hypothetical protein